MISKQKLREIAKRFNKKLSSNAIKKIESIVNDDIEKIMEKAARSSSFSGRVVIIEQDI